MNDSGNLSLVFTYKPLFIKINKTTVISREKDNKNKKRKGK